MIYVDYFTLVLSLQNQNRTNVECRQNFVTTLGDKTIGITVQCLYYGHHWDQLVVVVIEDWRNTRQPKLRSLLLKLSHAGINIKSSTHLNIKFYSRKHNTNNIMQVHRILIPVYKFVSLLNYF